MNGLASVIYLLNNSIFSKQGARIHMDLKLKKKKRTTKKSWTYYFVNLSVQISGLSSHINQVMSLIFFIGFGKMFLSFSRVFWTGGAGKNGSTVAVSSQTQ